MGKPMDSPRSATHQAQEDPAVQSTDSIETDEMEASNGDEVQPEASTESTGPDLSQHNSSDKEEETEDDFPENAPSKGHSLIVKSRDSKNKVSLVIKPLESSTEEPLESNTEQTVEFMSEDHVKSISEESPKPAENNESSSSR